MSNVNLTISPTVAHVTVAPVQPALTISGVTSIPSGGAGGDLGGSYPNPTVDGLQGRALASTAPSNGQLLAWNDLLQRWEPTTMTGGTGTVTQVSSGTGLTGGPITTSGTLSVDFAASGSATAGKAVEATDSRLSNSRAPTGSAGGGLSGTYPNPSLVAPGSANQVFFHSNGGFGSSAFFVWNNTTSTLNLSNALGESVSYRPSGITANGPFTIADTGGANSTAFTLDDAAETATFANFLSVDMTGADLTARRVYLKNSEYIDNEVDGELALMPQPASSNFVGLNMQFLWAFDTVRIGTKRSGTGALNDGRIQWLVPLQVFDNTNFILGDYSRSAVRQSVASSRPQTMQVGVNLVGTGPTQDHSNHAFVICHYGHLGNVNRMPTTLYADPSLLVYSLDIAQPNDFARLTHDQTDGLLESGNGKMRIKGASVVRIEGPSGGFDLPATAGSVGQVLTTDGTNASWATPTSGGLSEEDAVALAVAL